MLLAAALALSACTGGDGGGGGGDGQIGTPLEAPGVAAVELVGPPAEGAGEVPTFEWKPVQGAAAYHLVVKDADGNAVWAWQGEATSVALGGVPDRPAAAEGPVLSAGSSWSVSALDGEGHVLAVSVLRPVSP
jgi:hypothetical protein